MQNRSPRSFVAGFVEAVQSGGRLSFSLRDVERATGAASTRLRSALYRLAASGAIIRITPKADFFLIVPPEYRSLGVPPVEYWLDDFMAHFRLPYYLGLLSAAEAYGSAHFAVMETQVATQRWMRSITVGRTRLRFFQKPNIAATPIERRQNLWGQLAVSSPEATVIDLLHFEACSIGRVALILEDLVKSFRVTRLIAALTAADDTPTAQRLGYLLQRAGADRLASAIEFWLRNRHPRKVDLEAGAGAAESEDAKWRVRINANFEVAA